MEREVPSCCIICAGPSVLVKLVGEGGSDSVSVEHLKVSFILQKVLKTSQQEIRRLLDNSQSVSDGLLVGACGPCGKSLRQFFVTLKLMSKLEARLHGIEAELKEKIRKSMDEGQGHNENGSSLLKFDQIRGNELSVIEVPCHNEPGAAADDISMLSHKPVEDPYSEFVYEACDSQPIDEDFKLHIEYLSEDLDKGQVHQQGENNAFPPYIVNSSFSTPPANNQKQYDIHIPVTEQDSSFHTTTSDKSCNDSGSEYEPTPKQKRPKPKLLKGLGMKSLIQKKKKKKQYYSQKCSQCPFATPHKLSLENHLKLHEEGSEAVICSDCGWYVRPNRLNVHRGKRHKGKGNQTKIVSAYHTPLKATEGSLKRGRPVITEIYRCTECPYKSSNSARFKTHLSTHEQESRAVIYGWERFSSHCCTRHHASHVRNELSVEDKQETVEEKVEEISNSSIIKPTATNEPNAKMKNTTNVSVSKDFFMKALHLNWRNYQHKNEKP